MGTKPVLMVMEDAPYGATRNPAQPICPERFSMIYTTHYRYVLGICHRFFRQREDADFESIPDRSISSPLSQLLRKDEHRQFREQLTRLPHRYKAPLMLLYYKRMSYSEVARALNTRLPALRTMIFRAKGYMRRNLHAAQCEQN